MTTSTLARQWRNSERIADATMVAAIAFGLAGVYNDWPQLSFFLIMAPLMLVTCVWKGFALLLRWKLQRQGHKFTTVWLGRKLD